MKFKTCVSVAQRTPKRMLHALERALDTSDLAELRLDFLKPSQVPDVLDAAKENLARVICTLRHPSEGGAFVGDEAERVLILKLVAEYDPYLLDVEYRTICRNRSLARYVDRADVDLLISWHDFEATPAIRSLLARLDRMRRFSKNVKMVTSARDPTDASRILSLYARAGDMNLVAFAMGTEGRISRVVSMYLGSPFAYVSMGKAVAPGQYSLREFKKFMDV